MFGEGHAASNAASPSGYEQAATRAAYYTGFYSARMGGSVYFTPSSATSDQLRSFLIKKSGGGDGQTHDDKNLPAAVLATKTTALDAVARAKILGGKSSTTAGPEVEELPFADDMDADVAKAGPNTAPGDNVENRIKANEAEAAAVQAARDDGWFD